MTVVYFIDCFDWGMENRSEGLESGLWFGGEKKSFHAIHVSKISEDEKAG